jgi:AcrR family transcriptional regulator
MEASIKSRIIDTAYRLFKELGYDNVSVNQICHASGITKPTFYRYLKSKDDLISYFYDRLTGELADSLLTMIAAENYWEQIWAGFRSILDWSLEFGQDLYSQLFVANLKENKGTFHISEPLMRAMVVLVERAQNADQIRNKSKAEDLYRNSIYLSFGYGVNWCIEKGSFDLLKEFRAALENMYDVAPEYRKCT